MKTVVLRQYQDIVNRASQKGVDIIMPEEGWLRTLRKALGMSGAQLGRRIGVSRAQIAKSERNEMAGVITLKTLENMAQAMGARIAYTIVLPTEAEKLVSERANEKAQKMLQKTNAHMALESQALDRDALAFELERLKQELLREMPADLWDA